MVANSPNIMPENIETRSSQNSTTLESFPHKVDKFANNISFSSPDIQPGLAHVASSDDLEVLNTVGKVPGQSSNENVDSQILELNLSLEITPSHQNLIEQLMNTLSRQSYN